jgi:hypothetical protein
MMFKSLLPKLYYLINKQVLKILLMFQQNKTLTAILKLTVRNQQNQ